jgi:hypothetical protein
MRVSAVPTGPVIALGVKGGLVCSDKYAQIVAVDYACERDPKRVTGQFCGPCRVFSVGQLASSFRNHDLRSRVYSRSQYLVLATENRPKAARP